MDEARIAAIAERVARGSSGKLSLGPQKKFKGRNTMGWSQAFKFNPEGWELDNLIQKITRYLKSPPTQSLAGYASPNWFVQFKTRSGTWQSERWDRMGKTYQKLVEQGELTGTGIAGWVFVQER